MSSEVRKLGRPVLQIEARIEALPGADSFAVGRQAVLKWLEQSPNLRVTVPKKAYDGEPFSVPPEHGGAMAEAVVSRSPIIWACQVVNPDNNVAGRVWIVEIALYAIGPTVRIATRVSCAAKGDMGFFLPAVPAFVRGLMDRANLTSGGEALTPQPHHIVDSENLEELIGFIQDEMRMLPILVISKGLDGWPFDPNILAKDIAGLAFVYTITNEMSWELTNQLSKPWSVFNGACRIYLPGFDREAQSPYDHPLFIHNPDSSFLPGRLRSAIAQLSVDSPVIYKRHPRFTDLRRDLIDIESKREALDVGDLKASLALLEHDLALAKSAEDDWRGLAEQYASDNLIALETIEEIKRENANLRGRVRSLALRADAVSEDAHWPSSYAELPEWVSNSFASRLVLARKAQRAVVSSQYQDIKLVCSALEALAMAYVNMRNGLGRTPFEQSLERISVSDEPIAANPDRYKKEPAYWCQYEGRPFFMDRHLKRGISRDSREALRIYYAWDEETQQVIVGHLTSHLPTDIS
jgi:hypothetical protein